MLPETFDPNFHGDPEGHPWITKIPYRKLGKTNLKVSTLSYGGSALGNFYGDVDRKMAIATIQESIKAGINYIDTSPWYGVSEEILGEALKDIPRKTFYIGTKVGRNFTPGWKDRFDFSASAVLKNVENSLRLLGVSYVDIIQVHDAEFCLNDKKIIEETIPALESIVKAGKAKFIGITGYDLETLRHISEMTNVDTILSYARYNFHDMSLQKYLPEFERRNIGVINASPVAMGLFTCNGPPDWHPASDEVKAFARSAGTIAQQSGSNLHKAALGFSLRPDETNIATTLVSIPTPDILHENLSIVAQKKTLEDEELYRKIFDDFHSTVKCSGHWEGVEIEDYKKTMGSDLIVQ